MRTPFYTLLLVLIGSCSFAQTKQPLRNITIVGKEPGMVSSLQDTVKLKEWLKQKRPNNSMPNAISVPTAPPVYQGNNGQGFDVYKSRIDNMPILVNDSSFVSNMPNILSNMPVLKTIIDTVPVNGFYRSWPELKNPAKPKYMPTQPKPYIFPKNK